jgi:hypothetical protein
VRTAAQLGAAANVAAAEASVQTADLNLSFTRVTAPLTGRASYRRLAPGNIVAADTTVLTTIVTEDPIRFLFDVPESALLKYKREAGGANLSRVEIRLQDETEYRWNGHVDFLDNALDPARHDPPARRIDNPDGSSPRHVRPAAAVRANRSTHCSCRTGRRHRPDAPGRVHSVDAEGVVGGRSCARPADRRLACGRGGLAPRPRRDQRRAASAAALR